LIDTDIAHVNFWHFNTKLENEDLKKAWFNLPESLLLSNTLSDGQQKVVDSIKTLFITKKQNLVYSNYASPLINSRSRFAMSVGIQNDNQAAESQSIKVDSKQIASELITGLFNLSFNIWLAFIKKANKNDTKYILKNMLLPSIAVFLVYLGLSSAYLMYQQQSLTAQLDSYRDKVDIALQLERDLETEREFFFSSQLLLNELEYTSPLWVVLFNIYPDVQLSNIRIANNRFVIRGKTVKATDILVKLNSINNINDAQFDYPVSRSRNKEVFVISFTFSNLDTDLKHKEEK
jgi:hypothetical protein